jgi:hypothetical protein
MTLKSNPYEIKIRTQKNENSSCTRFNHRCIVHPTLLAIEKPAKSVTGITRNSGDEDPAKKKAKAKAFASHNNSVVKIYPDA